MEINEKKREIENFSVMLEMYQRTDPRTDKEKKNNEPKHPLEARTLPHALRVGACFRAIFLCFAAYTCEDCVVLTHA